MIKVLIIIFLSSVIVAYLYDFKKARQTKSKQQIIYPIIIVLLLVYIIMQF
jgi:ABC-type Na+ efflux pump permease subunit